jgi:flagellar protein FlaF
MEDNVLPDETRAGIISLAIWVDKNSRKMLRGEAKIKPLIDVNRLIMEGMST